MLYRLLVCFSVQTSISALKLGRLFTWTRTTRPGRVGAFADHQLTSFTSWLYDSDIPTSNIREGVGATPRGTSPGQNEKSGSFAIWLPYIRPEPIMVKSLESKVRFISRKSIARADRKASLMHSCWMFGMMRYNTARCVSQMVAVTP